MLNTEPLRADEADAASHEDDDGKAPPRAPSVAATDFLRDLDRSALEKDDLRASLDRVLGSPAFGRYLRAVIAADAYALDFADGFARADAMDAVAPSRMLHGAMNLSLEAIFQLIAQVGAAFDHEAGKALHAFADRLHADEKLGSIRLRKYLTEELESERGRRDNATYADELVRTDPHAVYPTSPYRTSTGKVAASEDHREVEAVMHQSTFASIRMIDHVLEPEQTALRDIYRPLGRCVCFVDTNVEEHYGDKMQAYFEHHGIPLTMLPYRAMEADKGLGTVERMLGDLKKVGIMRNEPVLIAGGGVLADTAGLACALYGRNTPYVMIGTSIVTGIDAGPSPRTCCDGFGYKNLLGAYHPPVLCLTDRFFFGSLREGWLRHGVAEIVKMAIVKDFQLFEDLEEAVPNLVETRFGTQGADEDDPIHDLSNRILGAAMKSYVEAEYDNLYETHQCRPHAYGHTWSPGFEIEAGLLHGHAVAICMGLGAHLSHDAGWISEEEYHRILKLMSDYGLALWHDILENEDVMREAHRKIVQKRGGNLVAPVPRGGIGECGYLDDLTEDDVLAAVSAYREVCADYPREGRGIDPLCEDVGLEDPGTVANSHVACAHG